MSGGYFDYIQHRIEYEIIEKLAELRKDKELQNNQKIDYLILKEIISLEKNLKNTLVRIKQLDYFLEGDNSKEDYVSYLKNKKRKSLNNKL